MTSFCSSALQNQDGGDGGDERAGPVRQTGETTHSVLQNSLGGDDVIR